MTMFEIKVGGDPGTPPELLDAFYTTAMRRVGYVWWRDMMPGHFTAAGARKYHYGKRLTKNVMTGKIHTYRGKPRAEDGRPLVSSGRSMRSAKSNKRIEATPKSCRVIMPMVKAFNFHPPKNYTLRMRDEFSRVTNGEMRILSKVARDSVINQLKSNNYRPVAVKVIT